MNNINYEQDSQVGSRNQLYMALIFIVVSSITLYFAYETRRLSNLNIATTTENLRISKKYKLLVDINYNLNNVLPTPKTIEKSNWKQMKSKISENDIIHIKDILDKANGYLNNNQDDDKILNVYDINLLAGNVVFFGFSESKEGQNGKFEYAFTFYEKASKERRNDHGAFLAMAICRYALGDYDGALTYLKKSQESIDAESDLYFELLNIEAQLLENAGAAEKEYAGLYKESLQYFEPKFIESAFNASKIYSKLGNDSKALEIIEPIIDLIKNRTEGINNIYPSYIYNHIGTCYINNLNYDNAIYYYNKALEIREEAEIDLEKAQILNNLSVAYSQKADITGNAEFVKYAIEVGKEALFIRKKNLDQNNISEQLKLAESMINLGAAYKTLYTLKNEEDDIKSSKKLIYESINIIEKIDNKNYLLYGAYSVLDYILYTEEKYEESLILSIKAYDIYKDKYPEINLKKIYLSANIMVAYGKVDQNENAMNIGKETLNMINEYIYMNPDDEIAANLKKDCSLFLFKIFYNQGKLKEYNSQILSQLNESQKNELQQEIDAFLAREKSEAEKVAPSNSHRMNDR